MCWARALARRQVRSQQARWGPVPASPASSPPRPRQGPLSPVGLSTAMLRPSYTTLVVPWDPPVASRPVGALAATDKIFHVASRAWIKLVKSILNAFGENAKKCNYKQRSGTFRTTTVTDIVCFAQIRREKRTTKTVLYSHLMGYRHKVVRLYKDVFSKGPYVKPIL